MQVYLFKYDLLAIKEGVIKVTTTHSKFIQNQTFFLGTERFLEVPLKFI
jgi:hypothetical protein